MLPSQLVELYWSITYEDIRFKIKTKISERMADFTQHYENLGSVVSQMFGGGDDSPSSNTTKAKPVQTWQEAQLAAAAVFG